jgi:hypothetical protein
LSRRGNNAGTMQVAGIQNWNIQRVEYWTGTCIGVNIGLEHAVGVNIGLEHAVG